MLNLGGPTEIGCCELGGRPLQYTPVAVFDGKCHKPSGSLAVRTQTFRWVLRAIFDPKTILYHENFALFNTHNDSSEAYIKTHLFLR